MYWSRDHTNRKRCLWPIIRTYHLAAIRIYFGFKNKQCGYLVIRLNWLDLKWAELRAQLIFCLAILVDYEWFFLSFIIESIVWCCLCARLYVTTRIDRNLFLLKFDVILQINTTHTESWCCGYKFRLSFASK